MKPLLVVFLGGGLVRGWTGPWESRGGDDPDRHPDQLEFPAPPDDFNYDSAAIFPGNGIVGLNRGHTPEI